MIRRRKCRQREWRRLPCAAAAIVVLVAGCSDSVDPESFHPEFADFIAAEIEQAIERGASDQQLVTLERARSRGSVTWEDVEESHAALKECYDEHQIRYYDEPVTYDFGIPVQGLSVGPPPGETAHDGPWLAIADECYSTHYSSVESAFRGQPQSREFQDAYWRDNHREPLLECLKNYGPAHGIVVDEDSTDDELHTASLELTRATGAIDPYSMVDCFYEAGY